MKPFNLSEALAGKPVVTRDGRKVTEIYHFKTAFHNEDKVVGAVINGKIYGRNISGRQSAVVDNDLDLFMAPESIDVCISVWRHKTDGECITRSFLDELAENPKYYPEDDWQFVKTEKITIEI